MDVNELVINQLGFQYDSAVDVTGRISISDKFPKSKFRCGIYLLGFANGTYYIGQALDVVRRFSQHRRNYSDIVSYWFQPIPKFKLDAVEKHLIQAAEEQGLLLNNRTFVSNIIGDTDLDLIVMPDEQSQWLDQISANEQFPNDLYSSIAEKFRVRGQQKFVMLTDKAQYPQIRRILSFYANSCLAKPTLTQLSFWALSCLPSAKNGFLRYFCLSINAMEVFVAGHHKKTSRPFSFLVASESIIGKHVDTLRIKYPSLKNYKRDYRAAGADQITLDFSNLDELEACLREEPLVRQAIKHLNLRLMRKGGTIYSPYHCFDLANDILT